MNFILSSRVSPGAKVPGLLHRFVRVARPSVATEALLIDVVKVDRVGVPVGLVKIHFSVVPRTGWASIRLGSNLKPLIVQWPEVRSKLKLRVTVGSPMSGSARSVDGIVLPSMRC